MAKRGARPDVQGMEPSPVPRVREEPADYGPHEVDDDAFLAARVLDDLTRTPDEAVPRVLARYAALRSWLLREARADPVLVGHGEAAARAYLAVTDGPEAEHLAELAEAEPAVTAFREAGAAASKAGHTEGAYALYHAGYQAARRRGDLAGAAGLATSLAELLKAEGLDGVALWTRRAEQLRRSADSG